MRSALDELGVAYSYADIHQDEQARQRVREINHGCESVPTLVFPDGLTLTEPSLKMLRDHLQNPDFGIETGLDEERRPRPGWTHVIPWIGLFLVVLSWILTSPGMSIVGFLILAAYFIALTRKP